ncbi:uncharacterized protein LACBIDRAFT_325792 [Laccaria bicolor S238N-H82]|uniref:Predicted protein n=1 Tax=Laccaria bicolor (strain S238N-H82 / ATCC MYA-4686) TaxID=486041 RepID=B0D683_LACBS|nr:uncharacterized protein LACBIDRAFT_325792 [Laccaria bicolor S238N-H82]EDR09896.1 predicted protein [Laccaria bicolor S238N-H82]|eukprot:XP_001879281.1 predicted protein [Laccaria bicolor S238N-H82]
MHKQTFRFSHDSTTTAQQQQQRGNAMSHHGHNHNTTPNAKKMTAHKRRPAKTDHHHPKWLMNDGQHTQAATNDNDEQRTTPRTWHVNGRATSSRRGHIAVGNKHEDGDDASTSIMPIPTTIIHHGLRAMVNHPRTDKGDKEPRTPRTMKEPNVAMRTTEDKDTGQQHYENTVNTPRPTFIPTHLAETQDDDGPATWDDDDVTRRTQDNDATRTQPNDATRAQDDEDNNNMTRTRANEGPGHNMTQRGRRRDNNSNDDDVMPMWYDNGQGTSTTTLDGHFANLSNGPIDLSKTDPMCTPT